MSRIRRLEHHQFVGLRDTLALYDTDDPDQCALLRGLAGGAEVVAVLPVVTFAPDTAAEARSRGYRPQV